MRLVLAILALWTIPASAAPHPGSDLSRTCEIVIREDHHSGAKERRAFSTLLNSRAECYELAKLHRGAIVSSRIKARHVSYEWARARKMLSRKSIALPYRKTARRLPGRTVQKMRVRSMQPVYSKSR